MTSYEPVILGRRHGLHSEFKDQFSLASPYNVVVKDALRRNLGCADDAVVFQAQTPHVFVRSRVDVWIHLRLSNALDAVRQCPGNEILVRIEPVFVNIHLENQQIGGRRILRQRRVRPRSKPGMRQSDRRTPLSTQRFRSSCSRPLSAWAAVRAAGSRAGAAQSFRDRESFPGL